MAAKEPATIQAMNGSAGEEDLELRHYIEVLFRRKLIIIVTTVIALLAGVAFLTVTPPVYESTAQVLLQPSLAEQVFSADSGGAKGSGSAGASGASGSATGTGSAGSASPQVASQVAVMQSASVRDPAKKALHLTDDPSVTVAAIGTSNVVGITVEADSAKEAARIAQTYAETYVDMHRSQVLNDLKITTDALATQIAAIEAQIVPLDQSLADLNSRIDSTAVLTSRAPITAQRDQVSQQRQSLDTRRSDLQSRLDRLQLDTTVTKTGGVAIVSNAAVVTDPISPKKTTDLALALALGVLGGIALAFVRDHLDDRIKSDKDLRNGTSRPILGVVPAVRGWDRSGPPLLVSSAMPQAPAADAYARLGTVLELKGVARVQVLQITGAHSGDGTTTTAANLGIALARGGRQVVLVDANLRRPRLHGFFDLGNYQGLTSVLRGEIPLADALVGVYDEPGLRVLPTGPIPPNPAELLGGQGFRDLITRLRFEGHLVIFDGPPLPLPDAMILADRVDGVLLVAYFNRTPRSELAETFALLEYIDTPLVGTILNGTHDRKGRRRFFFGRGRRQASDDSPYLAESAPTKNGSEPAGPKTRVSADK